MPEFKLRIDYSRKKKAKFFNDQEPKEYHYFLVLNHKEVIPNEYVYFAENRNIPCWIIISDSLIKGNKINFEDPMKVEKEYKFIVNLGEDKTAKFNINKKNWMVLKTKEYFENTVQKIGFWDSENYFYETRKKKEKPTKNQENSPSEAENKTEWGKITLICLSVVALVLISFLIIKWVSKKNKK